MTSGISRTMFLALLVCFIIGFVYIRIRNHLNKREFTAEEYQEYDEAKMLALEKILGKMDDTLDHALIPFIAGGTVDMYYFSRSYIPGTVVVTMELIGPDGKGPKAGRLGTYELVMCTRKPHNDENEDFRKIAGQFNIILTTLANYSFQTVINPNETAELPAENPSDTNYIVFDEFDAQGIAFEIMGKKHGLLLVIEVYKSELDYARTNGTAELIKKLRTAGVYPYSDLNREPVL